MALRLLLAFAIFGPLAVSAGCQRKPAPPPTTGEVAATPTSPTTAPTPTEATADVHTAAADTLEVTLCDDKTKTTIAAGPVDRVMAQSIADDLMARWKKANPDFDWEADERASRTFIPSHDNSALVTNEEAEAQGEAQGEMQGQTYRRISERDVLLWKRETEKAVVAGSRVFHSGDELGSTIAVSCDMCHPNAANTHPETYPKFQTQMGRVVLLRDMINWCLMHPVRAPPMEADDPRMRSMEAYIISQRAGKVMAYGKH